MQIGFLTEAMLRLPLVSWRLSQEIANYFLFSGVETATSGLAVTTKTSMGRI